MNVPRDAGSRTVMDILLRREGDPAADRAAVMGRSGRIITCHMRAEFEPFPSKWKIGNLHLDGPEARWRPGIRASGGGELIPQLQVIRIREVGERGEWNIKRRIFQVIEATTDHGGVALAVPANTAKLVAERLSHPPRD